MEEVKQKRRLPDWAVKLLIWVGPSLALLLLHMWGFGLVLSDGTWITFCLVPIFGLILTRLVFLFRSRRSAAGKAWRTILWVIVLVPLWFFALFFPRELHRCTRIRPRERFEAACCEVFSEDRLLPLELGEPESVECHSYVWSALIFESHSRTLLCRYGEADYPEAKAALEARYRFRTEPLDTEWAAPGKEVKQIEPYTSIGDDSFRFLLPGDGDNLYGDSFYKRCLLVVTNDARHEIGYVLFDDFDLDIAEDLGEFLMGFCGWRYIR